MCSLHCTSNSDYEVCAGDAGHLNRIRTLYLSFKCVELQVLIEVRPNVASSADDDKVSAHHDPIFRKQAYIFYHQAELGEQFPAYAFSKVKTMTDGVSGQVLGFKFLKHEFY